MYSNKQLFKWLLIIALIYLLISNDYVARRLIQLPELLLNYF